MSNSHPYCKELEEVIQREFGVAPGDLVSRPEGIVVYLGVSSSEKEVQKGYALVNFLRLSNGSIYHHPVIDSGKYLSFDRLSVKDHETLIMFFHVHFKRLHEENVKT